MLESEAKARLSAGKPLAQILSSRQEGEDVILRFVTLDADEEKAYGIRYHEVFDESDEGYLDITDFTPFDEEEPYGITTDFDTVEAAFAFAETEYGAFRDKYVAESMLEEEFAKYVKNRT
ncbi:hypothetical protein [Hymenobacter wooponensis]|uniref:Uncharacterized protein n=1 Tax=Hymenobacter wooponensis TaxID=1525360 RepID=A0A4Z0MDM7_9BACT|nr:hypothetical protein [Hymenobacter wooponensis]TGD77863.1 hypothetical protein EU557_21445 [Hymenobacter wooponensis]